MTLAEDITLHSLGVLLRCKGDAPTSQKDIWIETRYSFLWNGKFKSLPLPLHPLHEIAPPLDEMDCETGEYIELE